MAFESAWGHDGVAYNGKEMRELVETLTGGGSGVTGGPNALKVSQQTVAAATVKVAEGGAIIPATGAGLGGSYQVYNDADLNSPTISPTGADGRKDRLIIRVTAGVPALEVVQGVASGSPVEPSITGDNYLELALITLPASTTNITDAMITNRGVRYDLNLSAARASANATTSIAASAWTLVALAVEDYDYGNNFAASQYVAPVTGLYDVRGAAAMAATNAIHRFAVGIAVGGSVVSQGTDTQLRGAAGGDTMGAVVADVIRVTAGQTIDLRAFQANGGGGAAPTNGNAASNYLSIRRV